VVYFQFRIKCLKFTDLKIRNDLSLYKISSFDHLIYGRKQLFKVLLIERKKNIKKKIQ